MIDSCADSAQWSLWPLRHQRLHFSERKKKKSLFILFIDVVSEKLGVQLFSSAGRNFDQIFSQNLLFIYTVSET